MSAIEKILERKVETFEEAERDAIGLILERRIRTGPEGFEDERILTREVPRVVRGEGVGFKESFKQGFIEDIDVRIRRLAKQKFPGDPNATNRFGVIDNDIVFVNEQGLLEKSQSGAADLAGTAASFSPEVAGSVIGSFATGNPVTGAAVGAAGGRAVKDIIAQAFLDDPKTPLGVAENMATEAGLDLAAGFAGRQAGRIFSRKGVSGIDSRVFKSSAERERVKELTGIELDLAQVTNLPKLKQLKIYARNFPGDAGEIIKANDELVAGQVDEAISRVLKTVAKESDTARLGTNAINAAEASITAARTEVASKVSPLYKQAFTEGKQVNVDSVVKLIDDKLKSAKGEQRATLVKVKELLKVPGKKSFDTSIEGLHGSKRALDVLFERRGSESLGPTIRRDLVEIKSELLHQLSSASPAYDAARQMFESETARIVDPLRDGIIGVLANVPEQRAATAAAKMFADGNVNANAIRIARTAIEKESPEAWNGIVRQWLEHQFNAASKELQTGEALNIAGKFRQRVIGTRAQKAAMREALGPDAQPLFDVTMEALQMVSRTPTSSSQTEFMKIITEELKGNVGRAARVGRSVTSPFDSPVKAIEDKALQNQVRRIAEALTDPEKVGQLKILRELSPGRDRAAIAAGIIGLSLVPRDFAGNLLFPEGTIIPEILKEPGQPAQR